MKFARQIFMSAMLLTITNLATARTSETLRIATYNIMWMSTESLAVGDRTPKLKTVISNLDADVVALQEVADRAAVETVFPRDQWNVIIDDDSDDKQETAFAVRKHLVLSNVAADLDAGDENYLAAGPAHEHFFPNRRDGLTITVSNPETSRSIHLVSIHSKARVGGRTETDERRAGASKVLVEIMKARWPGQSYALLGDFNDNPDDQSLNILETGNGETSAGASAGAGPFLINLCEPLVANDMVSHGASEFRLDSPDVNLLDNRYSGSRERNNKGRNRLANSGPILFDQILVTPDLYLKVASGTAQIFREKIAVQGPGATRPSDHLPVYADIKWTR